MNNIVNLIHCPDKKSLARLGYWIKIFQDSKVPFGVIVRNYDEYIKVKLSYYLVDVFFADSNLMVEQTLSSFKNLKNVFYMTDNKRNIHLYLFGHLKHIFIGTKNSDLLLNVTKSFRAYDEIWVSSEYMLDKFQNVFNDLGHLKIKILGKPQLKQKLMNNQNKIFNKTLLLFSEENNFILNMLINEIDKKKKSSIVVNNNLDVKEFNLFIMNNSLDVHILSNNMSLDLVEDSVDFFIMDINYFSINYFLYNKPIILYIPKNMDIENIIFSKIVNLDILYTFSDAKDFKLILNEINLDRLKKNREKFIQYMFGRQETIHDLFIKELQKDL